MLGFVEPSFVWSSLTTWPDPNTVAWFLMGDLLRLSPRENFFGPFLYIETNFGWLGFLLWVVLPCFLEWEKIL